MTEPLAVTKDRFDRLLTEWKMAEDAIAGLQDEQGDVVAHISRLFSDIVTDDQLLADLPWEVYTYPSGNTSPK